MLWLNVSNHINFFEYPNWFEIVYNEDEFKPQHVICFICVTLLTNNCSIVTSTTFSLIVFVVIFDLLNFAMATFI